MRAGGRLVRSLDGRLARVTGREQHTLAERLEQAPGLGTAVSRAGGYSTYVCPGGARHCGAW